ncbi:hypothetical protein C0926_000205 [Escherichia coli]|nr:hypothetical protein [Escherichia coli]
MSFRLGITFASFGYVAAEKVASFHFKNTISDHSSMTVLGIAADGQKNGIPIGGAPAPKRTFIKMQRFFLQADKYRYFV